MIFDVEKALSGMGGDLSLLHETLQDFVDFYGDAGEKIRAAVDEERYTDAEILAHTLKGLGGTFAAMRLRDAALTVELAARNRELGGLEQKVSDLGRAIDEMVSDIATVLKA